MRSWDQELFCSVLTYLKLQWAPAHHCCTTTLMGTGLAPLQESNAGSGAWTGHLLTPSLAEHPAQLWAASLLPCSPAFPLCVFPLQLGVCDPAVLCTLPTEKVRMGNLPACTAPQGRTWGACGMHGFLVLSNSQEMIWLLQAVRGLNLCAHTCAVGPWGQYPHGLKVRKG